MQKNLPEIKWLIVLLVKEIKKYFKSEKEEIEQTVFVRPVKKTNLVMEDDKMNFELSGSKRKNYSNIKQICRRLFKKDLKMFSGKQIL